MLSAVADGGAMSAWRLESAATQAAEGVVWRGVGGRFVTVQPCIVANSLSPLRGWDFGRGFASHGLRHGLLFIAAPRLIDGCFFTPGSRLGVLSDRPCEAGNG